MSSKVKIVQYSKKLTTAITVIWCGYRLMALAAVLLKPELGDTVHKMVQGMDDIMICNIFAYNGNSLGEKGFISYFQSKNKNGFSVDNSEEESTNG